MPISACNLASNGEAERSCNLRMLCLGSCACAMVTRTYATQGPSECLTVKP